MISFIVCSVDNSNFNRLKANLSATITCEYEIIRISNAKELGGLCSAYNFGASKSKYEFICFCHDDIMFNTVGWEKEILLRLRNNPTVGAIGLAGATMKSKSPSPWWVANERVSVGRLYEFIDMNIHDENCGKIFHEVLVLDGLALFCRKMTWENVKFDDVTIKGFHFYDIDWTLNLWKKGYHNFVLEGISVKHLSKGFMDESWYKVAPSFYKKWAKHLPITISDMSKDELKILERQAIKSYLTYFQGGRVRFVIDYIKIFMLYVKNSGNWIDYFIYLRFLLK